MLRILQVVAFYKLTLSDFARIRPLLHPFGERQDLTHLYFVCLRTELQR